MKVQELLPGMQFEDLARGHGLNTFIARCPHPYYPGLNLVIWRLCDGEISLDALSAAQDVGEPIPLKANPLIKNGYSAVQDRHNQLRENVRRAIGIGGADA